MCYVRATTVITSPDVSDFQRLTHEKNANKTAER